MKKLAIIGYGALGKILVSVILDQLTDDYELKGIFDIAVNDPEIPVYQDFAALLQDDLDLVVEIAGVKAVKEYGTAILESGRDLIITSVGSLADATLLDNLRETAKQTGRKVHLTSGAIGGFDLLKTVTMMGNTQVSVESTKAPKSLNGAPYLKAHDLPEEKKVTVFKGNAKEAIQGFPKNTNVSVAAAIASVGPQNLQVQIISDPKSRGNSHKITMENANAWAQIEVLAKPDAENPKSSITAAWSVAALLSNLANPIQLF